MIRKASIKNIIPSLIALYLISFIWGFIITAIIIAEILARFCFNFSSVCKKAFQKGLVSITIVNWNSKQYIEDCLNAIKKQKYPNIEVIIVDNNSNDGSLEYIVEYVLSDFNRVKIVRNNRNMGFSKAHNQAIHLAEGEYILPLNFDVRLSELFIENMVKAMKEDRQVGLSSGKLFSSVNGEQSILDTTGVELNNLFCCDRGQGQIDYGQFDKKEYIFGASGCAPFYRREMLEDIRFRNEYFDETFFIYVEDVDLSWRAQLKGWKCLYNPQAIAYHSRGSTRSGDDKAAKNIFKDYFIIGFRNRYLMILKNLGLKMLIRFFPTLIFEEMKFWLHAFSTGKWFYLKLFPQFFLLHPMILYKRIASLRQVKVDRKDIEGISFSRRK